MITGVRFPIAKCAAYASFRNPASRYAVVGVFVAKTPSQYRVAVTGASGSVFRWTQCEEALNHGIDNAAIDQLALDDDEFNDDIHASAAYRSHLVRVMTRRAVTQLS